MITTQNIDEHFQMGKLKNCFRTILIITTPKQQQKTNPNCAWCFLLKNTFSIFSIIVVILVIPLLK